MQTQPLQSQPLLGDYGRGLKGTRTRKAQPPALILHCALGMGGGQDSRDEDDNGGKAETRGVDGEELGMR